MHWYVRLSDSREKILLLLLLLAIKLHNFSTTIQITCNKIIDEMYVFDTYVGHVLYLHVVRAMINFNRYETASGTNLNQIELYMLLFSRPFYIDTRLPNGNSAS